MSLIQYKSVKFNEREQGIIDKANEIIAEYTADGYDLTLRQLYYQFVARGLIPNSQAEYKKLGVIISDARLDGQIDWDAIEDRTRNLRSNPHWETPGDIVEACAQQFMVDLWSDQDNYVEVWVEKDALIGVLELVCKRNDVPYFSCRGYTSSSELHEAAMRHRRMAEQGKDCKVIHLGDHDPSGIDMSRDIQERFDLFMGHYGLDPTEINRIALNMPQVNKYKPPPNPAKVTDPRAKKYIAEFGTTSWELDALDPKTLDALIQKTIDSYKDKAKFEARKRLMMEGRARLEKVADTLK